MSSKEGEEKDLEALWKRWNLKLFLNARIELVRQRSGTLSGWFYRETGTEEEHVGIHGQ